MALANERVTPPVFTGGIENATLKWRSIFAGAFMSLLAYFIFTSLGMAIGGDILADVARGEGAGGLGVGTGIWLIVTLLASLFIGSYLASRVSGYIPTRIGGIQGLVVSALFFAFLFSQIGAGIGLLSRGIGSTVGFLGESAGDLSQNPQVQSVVGDALGDLNLKSPPETVAQGVATRLLRGNDESARNYLANQAGITSQEADAKIQQFRGQFDQTMKDVGEGAAKGVSVAGWTIFGALLLGSLSSFFGGMTGARRNLSHPVSRHDRDVIKDVRAA